LNNNNGNDKIKVENGIQQRSYISFFWSGVCVFWQFCKVVKQGRAPGAPPPPKIGKNKIFWRKNVIFHTKYPKNIFLSAPPNLKSWIRPFQRFEQ
jgi:hypothetical protein